MAVKKILGKKLAKYIKTLIMLLTFDLIIPLPDTKKIILKIGGKFMHKYLMQYN